MVTFTTSSITPDVISDNEHNYQCLCPNGPKVFLLTHKRNIKATLCSHCEDKIMDAFTINNSKLIIDKDKFLDYHIELHYKGLFDVILNDGKTVSGVYPNGKGMHQLAGGLRINKTDVDKIRINNDNDMLRMEENELIAAVLFYHLYEIGVILE